MDFGENKKVEEYRRRLEDFMDSHIYPAESIYWKEITDSEDPHHHPEILEELKREAQSRGLWNLFLPDVSGLRVLEYAPIAEISGRSPYLAPEAMNCSAPDTGNMETLHLFGSEDQKARWLRPLLNGTIRSCFAMTEPAVASSDATNIATSIERLDDEYVINGRKWFSSGAVSPRCKLAIVMGVTDHQADRHRRHSMVLVPLDTPGVEIERAPSIFGYQHPGGHPQIRFNNVRVPAENLLAKKGDGFRIAQARLGPGRIHHCMRALGAAERALELMVKRSKIRTAFGKPLSDQGVIREWIAESRLRIEQARLLVLKTAWMIDTVGTKAARVEISGIKVAAPAALKYTADKAIQLFGAAGFTEDWPLADFYTMARWMQIADGPDEVHLRMVARAELSKHEQGADFEAIGSD